MIYQCGSKNLKNKYSIQLHRFQRIKPFTMLIQPRTSTEAEHRAHLKKNWHNPIISRWVPKPRSQDDTARHYSKNQWSRMIRLENSGAQVMVALCCNAINQSPSWLESSHLFLILHLLHNSWTNIVNVTLSKAYYKKSQNIVPLFLILFVSSWYLLNIITCIYEELKCYQVWRK